MPTKLVKLIANKLLEYLPQIIALFSKKRRGFFDISAIKMHFFQILEHCVRGAHLHSGPPAAAGNNFFICWAQMGFPDT